MSDDFMNESFDVFILQLCDRLPTQLRETLIQKGYPTYITSDLPGYGKALSALPRPIALVLCENGTEESFQNTKSLIERADLHDFPLILVGTEVDSYENILNQHFSVATTLNEPCANTDVLEAIAYVVRSYPKKVGTAEEPTEAEVPSVTSDQQTEETPDIPVIEHAAYKKGGGVPAVFFETLEKLSIPQGSLGGSLYPRGVDEGILQGNGYFPQDRILQEKIHAVCTDVGKWGRLHLFRSAYICQHILKSLNIPAEFQEQAKSAMFLFSISFAGDNADLLRKEYYEARQSNFRKELCSRIKDSAMNVALELKAPEIGNLIATLGRLVGREEAVNDSPISMVASAIMAADITDRVCFQSGYWNPRRTYTFLKKVKASQLLDMHPEVLCCVVKFLTEAMSAHPHAMVLDKHLKANQTLKKAAAAWKDQKVNSEEKKVALVNLMPGMRLSRPVMAYDGREILSSDIKLDQDLIWRLWQLSTVRPLNGPVVIFSKN